MNATKEHSMAILLMVIFLGLCPFANAGHIDIRTDPLDLREDERFELHFVISGYTNVTSVNFSIRSGGEVVGDAALDPNATQWVHVFPDGMAAGDASVTVAVVHNTTGEVETDTLTFEFAVAEDKSAITVDVILLMSLIGVVIIVGFIGTYIFDRFGIPEVLSLILLGILIGAGFHVLSEDLMDMLEDISPLFAAIALLIILFDGGINLSLDAVIKGSSKASILAVVAFLLTVVAVGFTAAVLLFEFKFLPALMLGAALGGTSGAIVIPTVMNLETTEDVKVLLSLESTITDVLCIVAAVSIAEVLIPSSGSGGASGAAQSIVGAFAVGILLGGIGGGLWLRLMPIIEKMRFGFMLTLAFVFSMYALTQFAGGSGPVAALAVGLVLANGPEIGRMFGYRETAQMSKEMKRFHSQIAFFVRSFFFVYTGLLFTIPGPMVFVYGIIITAIIYLVRLASVKAVTPGMRTQDRELMTILAPRGLAAAVLSTLPMTYGFEEEGILTATQLEMFRNISLIVIMGTVFITTAGIPLGKKRWVPERMADIEARRRERRERRMNANMMHRKERARTMVSRSRERAGSDSPDVLKAQKKQRRQVVQAEMKDRLRHLAMEESDRRRAAHEEASLEIARIVEEVTSRRKALEGQVLDNERDLDGEEAARRKDVMRALEERSTAVKKEFRERRNGVKREFAEKLKDLGTASTAKRASVGKMGAAEPSASGSKADSGTGPGKTAVTIRATHRVRKAPRVKKTAIRTEGTKETSVTDETEGPEAN
ncbi:MAG: cation:proton antiporter [Thermoplasmata archaeon]|nr:cation:proton antiporter [Thermoplasmata archaeon]